MNRKKSIYVMLIALIGIASCGVMATAQCLMPLKLVTPVSGAEVTTLTPNLEVNFDSAINNNPIDCILLGTHWVVATDPEMLNKVVDFETDGVGQNPIEVFDGVLELNRKYYWTARAKFTQNGNQHHSMFAPPRSFRTVLPRLDLPPIQLGCTWPEITNSQPSEGVENVALNPELRVSWGEPDPNNPCQVTEATWQVTEFCYCPDAAVIFETGFEPAQLRQYQLSEDVLNYDTPYKWYVKYKTADGDISEWLGPHIFSTMARPVGDPPPLRGAGDLCSLDSDGNGTIDDNEFFNAVDLWISEQVDDALFFEVVDFWIGQDDVCIVAASGTTRIMLSSNNSIIFQNLINNTSAMKIEIFTMSGDSIWVRTIKGNQLRWNMKRIDHMAIANGVYIARISTESSNGLRASEIRRFVVLR